MREYRYYFLGSLICTTVGFYLLYEYDVMTAHQFLWPTAVWTPLFALTVLGFINFRGNEEDQTYNEEQVEAVKQSASTPVSIFQSPILWLGLISLVIIVVALAL